MKSGFTLIEVMVALLVLAIAMSMFGTVGSNSLSSLERVEARTLASWIASNQITLLRLERAVTDEPIITGKRTRFTRMAGREWQVESTVRPTGHPWLRRIEVRVKLAGTEDFGDWSATLVGYVGRH